MSLMRMIACIALAASVTLVPVAPVARAQASEHVVQPGETLRGIAAHYGVGLADILAVNDIPNPNLIQIGQVIRLPGSAPAEPAPAEAPQAEAPAAEAPQEQAVAGVEAEPRAETSARGGERPAVAAVHIVQLGDTIGRIAAAYRLTVEAILAVNDLPNPNVIQVGQEIALPVGAEAAPAQEAQPAPAAQPPAERFPAVGGRYPIGTTLSGKVTMYCLRGIMRYGEYVHRGAAAADPSVWPAGTILEVEGFGRFVVKDTFARDYGDVRIDLWEPSCAVATAWGLRFRDITVIGP